MTAATLRLFGANFAELPFVATKEGELSFARPSAGSPAFHATRRDGPAHPLCFQPHDH